MGVESLYVTGDHYLLGMVSRDRCVLSPAMEAVSRLITELLVVPLGCWVEFPIADGLSFEDELPQASRKSIEAAVM